MEHVEIDTLARCLRQHQQIRPHVLSRLPSDDLSVGPVESQFHLVPSSREDHRGVVASVVPNATRDIQPTWIDPHVDVIRSQTYECGRSNRFCTRFFGSFEMNAHGRSIRFHRLREFHVFPTHLVHVQHGGPMLFAHLEEGGMIGIRPSQSSKHPVQNVGVEGRELVSDSKERCEVEIRPFE